MSWQGQLRRYVLEDLVFGEPVEFGDDEDLFEVGLDSMGILRTTAFLEEQLGKKIAADALQTEDFRTLGKLIQRAEELAGGTSPNA